MMDENRKKKITKKILMISSVIALIAVTVFGTLAYTSRISEETTNVIKSPKANASIKETLNGNIKESITVKADDDNTEDVYVRVALNAYWTSLSNPDELYTDAVPDLSQYINTNDWTEVTVPVVSADGTDMGFTNTYYLYKSKLAPGEETTNLLKTPISLTVDGTKRLEVTVLMQAADTETFEGGIMS